MVLFPKKSVAYDLASDSSKLRVLCTFANENLQTIHVLEKKGSPNLVKKTIYADDVELAKSFLGNYQMYTANPLFGELNSTLSNVDAGKNLTKTCENAVLEVTANNGYTNFKWYYSVNGAIAPYSKFVSLGFKNGFFTAFVDNWNIHRIGNTRVNFSKEEVVAIALDCARSHSWTMQLDEDTLDERNFNEKSVSWSALTFDSSLNANKTRSEDVLELYPVWRIGLVLNKWYGHLYGIEVDIWADTGEVRSIQEAWSTLPPPEGVPTANASAQSSSVSKAKLNLTLIVALPILAAVGIAIVWMDRRKESQYYSLLKRRELKSGGILLCILIASTISIDGIVAVNATTRAGVIWGARSSGAPNPPYSFSWRKTDEELSHQWAVAINIEQFFAAAGYTSVKHQGAGSSKTQILSDISYLKDTHDYLAVVDFDHGVVGYPGRAPGYPYVPYDETHFMFEDDHGTLWGTPDEYNQDPVGHTDWGHGVYDIDIYNAVSAGKVIFAFINTCESANITHIGQGYYQDTGNPLGMEFAWTHRLVENKSKPEFNITQHISNDGYSDPDVGSQVYIGFPYGSAALEQKIPYDYYGSQYYLWVLDFFYYALCWDYSVNDVLDLASDYRWGCGTFGNSFLRGDGFAAVWPMDTDGDGIWTVNPGNNSTMAVYGNGNIHLKQYEPDYVSTPLVSGPTVGEVGASYEFSASSIDPSGHSIRYTFDWNDSSPQTVTDFYPSNATAYASHTWGSEGLFSVTVKGQCINGTWSKWSSPRIINITQPSSLVVRGQDNKIWHRTYDPSSGWGSWNALPSGTTIDSPASTLCFGQQYFVVRGSDGTSLWFSWLNLASEEFSGWTQLTGSTPSAPALVNNGTHLFLAFRGMDNRMWHRTYDCAYQAWGDWTALPTGTTCDRPATALLDNKLHFVVRGNGQDPGQNDTLWHGYVDLADASFSGWTGMTGATDAAPSLTSSDSKIELYLTVKGMNGGIYINEYSGGAWQGWTYANATTCDGPATIAKGNRLEIVIRSTDGTSLYHSSRDLTTGEQSSWTLISGSTPSAPVFASTPRFKFHQLTVSAYNLYSGDPLGPGVKVDGQWVGNARVYCMVPEGWHYVEVDDSVDGGSEYGVLYFQYFLYAGSGYGNPACIRVDSDAEIAAYYWYR